MKYIHTFIFLFLFGACSYNGTNKQVFSLSAKNSIDSLMSLSKSYYYNYPNNAFVFDKFIKKALSISQNNNNKNKIGEIYNELGKRYRNNSEFNRAIWYHQQAVNIAKNNNLDTLLAYSIYKQSVVFRQINDNAQSYRLCVQSLEKAEHIKDTFLIHCSLNGIGNVYFNHGNYQKSIKYYRESLNFLGTKKHNYLGEAINTNTLGEAWYFLGNIDSALHYLHRSFDINTKINSKLGQAICYNGISLVYLKQKEYKKAIDAAKKAISVKSKKINLIYKAMFRNSLGKIYLELDSLQLAEKYLCDAFKISSEINSKKEALEASQSLVKLYQKLNNTNKLSQYTNYWMSYKDSITNHLIKQNSESMNVLYKAEQQQREILILKQNAELADLKINRQKFFFIFMIVMLISIIVIILLIYRHLKLQSYLNQITLEQRLFRSQLNPHFIFNSLSAMQSFIMDNNPLLANDYLARFSSLMRNVLISSRNEYLLLETELETIKNYLKLQQLRFNNKFNFSFSVAEDINPETCLIPPMIIQPFVENAIEHGMKGIDYTGDIYIILYRENGYLFIVIDDNGTGFKENKTNAKNHKSLATTIIKERLQVLKAKTKKPCSLTITNKKDEEQNKTGVCVKIKIPFVEDN